MRWSLDWGSARVATVPEPASVPPAALADPRFRAVLRAASSNAELVKQFDRLHQTNLARRGSGIELAVDDASGRTKADLGWFVAFVYDIFLRLPPAT